MNVLISGGSKNGKTAYAERVAISLSASMPGSPRYYVATMIPYDSEDRRRVTLHREERADLGFTTLEVTHAVSGVLTMAGNPSLSTFLIDSTTALLLNEMYAHGDYSAPPDSDAAQRCREDLLAVARGAGKAVFVSDWLYSDAVRYDDFTENYRRDLASIDRALAEVCDTVIEMSGGIAICHKGELIL